MKATNNKINRKAVTFMARQDAERLLRQLVGRALGTEDIVDLLCEKYLRYYRNGETEVRKIIELCIPELPPVLRSNYNKEFMRQVSHLTGRTPEYSDAWELPVYTWA